MRPRWLSRFTRRLAARFRRVNGDAQGREVVINGIEGDGALRGKADDMLRRAPWATGITKTLIELDSPEGIVVAIDGEWGSGKSSILNFIRESIEERNDDSLVAVDFNPWLYAPRAELAQALITEIAGAVGIDSPVWGKAKGLISGLATLARIVPDNAIISPGAAGEYVQALVADTRPLSKLKDDFSKVMVESGKRVVVFVDDIDRLEPREVSDLFSALKVLGDFPNTVYVLALDSRHVAKQLEIGKQTDDGAAYVEKMVQVSFPVPLPQPQQLQVMLNARIDDVIGEPKPHLRDEDEWKTARERVLQVLIAKPRDLIRLTNALRVTYPALRDQVNVVDFVLWEALRMLEPDAYQLVRSNLRFFGLPTDPWAHFIVGRDQDGNEQLDLLNEIRATVAGKDRREAVDRIIETLFPIYTDIAGQFLNRRQGSDRYHRRIADPDTFRLVLSQQIPDSIVPTELIESLLVALPNKEALDGWMEEQIASDAGPDGVAVVFAEAKLHSESISVDDRPQAMVNLMQSIEFDLATDHRDGLLYDLSFLVQSIMESLESEHRLAAVRGAMEAAPNSKPAVRLLRNIEQDSGLDGEYSARAIPEERRAGFYGSLSVEALLELESVAVALVARDVAAFDLLDMDDQIWLMHRWKIWDTGTSFSDWFDALRADNDRLKKLLRSIRSHDFLEGDREVLVRPNALHGLVDLDAVAEDVRRLQTEDQSEEAQTLTREFLGGLPRKDPQTAVAEESG